MKKFTIAVTDENGEAVDRFTVYAGAGAAVRTHVLRWKGLIDVVEPHAYVCCKSPRGARLDAGYCADCDHPEDHPCHANS